jgi:hypothetical protein
LLRGSELVFTRVGYDKAHCAPSDWVKMNQWVCALTL